MSVFERDDNKPGKPILAAGIMIYLVAVATLFVMLGVVGRDLFEVPILVLIASPIFLPIFGFAMFPIFYITGTPILSFCMACAY